MFNMGLILAVIFFLVGLAGTILPVLPGAPLILIGMVVYGLFAGFEHLSPYFFIGQSIATALTLVVDYAAGIWGVSRYGGSKAAVWGGAIGLLIGPFIFLGPLGIILGPFLGAFLGEMLVSQKTVQALRVGFGSLLGLIGSTLIKLFIEIVMIIWFFRTIYGS